MSQNNVIDFPKKNIRPDVIVPTEDQLEQKMQRVRTEFFSEISDEIIDSIVRKLAVINLPQMIGQEGSIDERDIIILKEAIVSMMCRLTNMPHPLHNHFNDIMTVTPVELENGEVIYSYELVEKDEDNEEEE